MMGLEKEAMAAGMKESDDDKTWPKRGERRGTSARLEVSYKATGQYLQQEIK